MTLIGDIKARIATARPGAAVTLPFGTYFGNFTLDKPIILKGSKPGTTLIGDEPSVAVLSVSAPRVIVTDLTIHQRDPSVPAVRIEGDAYPQFRRVHISGGPIEGRCALEESESPALAVAPLVESAPSRTPRRVARWAGAAAVAVIAAVTVVHLIAAGRPPEKAPSAATPKPATAEKAPHLIFPSAAEIGGSYVLDDFRGEVPQTFVIIMRPSGQESSFEVQWNEYPDRHAPTRYDPSTGRMLLIGLGWAQAAIAEDKSVEMQPADASESWHLRRVRMLREGEP